MKKDLLKTLLSKREAQVTELQKIIAKFTSDQNDLKAMIESRNTMIADMQEALDRRRRLYDSMLNYATIEKPKSMMEMAESLYDVCMERETSFLKEKGWREFQELSEAEQDLWMDRLLTILN